MYDFDFDYETNGIELSWRDTGGEIPRREARPVYAEDLNSLPVNAGYKKGNRRVVRLRENV